MENLVEVRWHGRGGQGAKTAAQLLAEAALESGKHIQAFPEYGPERAGAPIRAFTRIGDGAITLHCSVASPGVVVVLDPTLLDAVDITEGVGDKGTILINTDKSPEEIRKKIGFKGGTVGTVNATKIALDTLGRPLPNTPMLGALLKATAIVPVEALENSLRGKFLKKIGKEKTEGNVEAVRQAYKQVALD